MDPMNIANCCQGLQNCPHLKGQNSIKKNEK